MTLPAFFHKKLVLMSLALFVLLLYAAFNVWLFRMNAKPPQGTSAVSVPESSQSPTLAPPTPRLTGPGRYACDPNGICGDYSDEMRASCPVTFADRLCLDSCGDTAKRCSQ